MILDKSKIAAAVACTTLVLGTLAPAAFADTTLTISGNGSSSSNTTSVSSSSSNSVVQGNDANIQNNVTSSTKTGGNNANDNTGGSVTVDTGNTSSRTTITNAANVNSADLPSCGCSNGSTAVTISGNGSSSDNSVSVSKSNSSEVFQNNDAYISNNVHNHSNTGDNSADRNTGGTDGGSAIVISGNADATNTVTNGVNLNRADLGSSSSNTGSGSGLTVDITGNGSSSDNTANVDGSHSDLVVQGNDANIHNSISNHLKTGDNNANDNTGLGVLIDTGSATINDSITNMANANFVTGLGCGCLSDLMAQVMDNGSMSHNSIAGLFDNSSSIFQGGNDGDKSGAGNDLLLTNNLNDKGQTGYNNVYKNTSDMSSSTRIFTGDSTSTDSVSSFGNVNSVGSSISLPGGSDLSFSFDLGSLLSSLHLM